MNIHNTIQAQNEGNRPRAGAVISIGNFDGLHTGHRKILVTAKQQATQLNTELAIITFAWHPVAALRPQNAPQVLTPMPMKVKLLESFDVDTLYLLDPSPDILSLTPAEFIEDLIVKNLHPKLFVEGENFGFGKNRTGNVHTLQSIGETNKFKVRIVEPENARLSIGSSVKVSSTLIRSLICDGKVVDAAVAIGRPYRIIEKIIPGRGVGRTLGFATLNLAQPPQIVPAKGVYAGWVQIADDYDTLCSDGQKLPAVFSIGTATTFNSDNPLLIEAHVLAGDIPETDDKFMAMDFIEFIRPQQKFDSHTLLAAQIKKDCQKAKSLLKGGSNNCF